MKNLKRKCAFFSTWFTKQWSRSSLHLDDVRRFTATNWITWSKPPTFTFSTESDPDPALAVSISAFWLRRSASFAEVSCSWCHWSCLLSRWTSSSTLSLFPSASSFRWTTPLSSAWSSAVFWRSEVISSLKNMHMYANQVSANIPSYLSADYEKNRLRYYLQQGYSSCPDTAIFNSNVSVAPYSYELMTYVFLSFLPQTVMWRLQAAELGVKAVDLLLRLISLESVFHHFSLSLVTVLVVLQLTLESAVGALHLGHLKGPEISRWDAP